MNKHDKVIDELNKTEIKIYQNNRKTIKLN